MDFLGLLYKPIPDIYVIYNTCCLVLNKIETNKPKNRFWVQN